MISAEAAISRLRRDLTLGALLKGLLAAGVFVAFIVMPVVAPKADRTVALVVIGGIWLALSYTSVKGSRLSADSPALIASGQFEEAEQQIDLALRTFSLYRSAKLQSLHHLAVLRHAQRRWRESALLCRELLGQRLGMLEGLSKPARLLLADSMLELGDLRGAYEALAGLYRQQLSLAEVLNLLSVQVEYEGRAGAWEAMVNGLMNRVQLAELMPAGTSARTQALLALAARRVGRADLSGWLRRRAELLAEPDKLVAERPMLGDLWPDLGTVRPAVTGAAVDALSNPLANSIPDSVGREPEMR